MARALGVTEFLAKKFEELEFTGDWVLHMGKPESNFSMLIYGKSGNGKTEYSVMLAKYLTKFGKVYYNSFEQGHSKSLQDAWKRQKMHEVKGLIIVTHKETFEEMKARLSVRKSPKIVFIDSIQYIRLTVQQWHELKEMFPKKIFIMVSHAKGEEPDGYHAQKIEYDVDIKVLVKGYQAWTKSRYGGNEPYMIYEEGHLRWLARQKNYKPPVKKETTPANQSELFNEPKETTNEPE